MARGFSKSGTEYLDASVAPITGTPCTLSCWFYSTLNDWEDSTLFGVYDDGVTKSGFELYHSVGSGIDPNGGKLYCRHYAAGASAHQSIAMEEIRNAWHVAGGVFEDNTIRNVWLDGVEQAGSFTQTPSGTIDSTVIGADVDSGGYDLYHTGYVAEVAVWNVILTDPEMVALSKGYSPLLIRPGSLKLHVPLIRDNDYDLITGTSFSIGGSPTVNPHAPIFYPSSHIYRMEPILAADLNVNIGMGESAYQKKGLKVW